jgi:hypothetical protein
MHFLIFGNFLSRFAIFFSGKPGLIASFYILSEKIRALGIFVKIIVPIKTLRNLRQTSARRAKCPAR